MSTWQPCEGLRCQQEAEWRVTVSGASGVESHASLCDDHARNVVQLVQELGWDACFRRLDT